jgi:hypothetical protein
MSYTILDSLPFPRPEKTMSWIRKLVLAALRLTCTGPEMIGYWNSIAQRGWVAPVPADTPPPGVSDEGARLQLRAEIDAVVARDLFGLSRPALDYILETFPIVKRKDEERFGEYRTKLLILQAYDVA